MRVYVVLSGEKHEGGSLVGIFSDFERAYKFGLSQKSVFGSWKQDFDCEEPGVLRWFSGCDFVSIHYVKVNP